MLDHVQSPDLGLMEAHRVLKPAGQLVIGLYQCGMSAICSPAVRPPAQDDSDRHARQRADLIVSLVRFILDLYRRIVASPGADPVLTLTASPKSRPIIS
jgi:ubiquinone/menaquinone biosynthesis C-methylase UbiE